MSTVLVTGSHGWVGTHLRGLLAGRGHRVVGLGRGARLPGAGEEYLRVDLLDPAATGEAVAAVGPDLVFHLAAATPQREPDPARLVASCVAGTRHLGTALRRVARDRGYRPRLVLAGSSAQYGAVPRDRNPVTESTPPGPAGAYGHAKAAAESVALALAADGLIGVTAVRAFNHLGPGADDSSVAGALARRVARVAAGADTRVTVADLAAVRDYTDVRDVARAYLELSRPDLPEQVYNLCSGTGTPVRTLLETLLELAGLDWSRVTVGPDRGGLPHQVGSADRLRSHLAWRPGYTLRESLADLLTEVTADRPGPPGAGGDDRPRGTTAGSTTEGGRG